MLIILKKKPAGGSTQYCTSRLYKTAKFIVINYKHEYMRYHFLNIFIYQLLVYKLRRQMWSKTELKRCTTTEIRRNKNEGVRTFLVVSTNCSHNSLKNWRVSLSIGPWDSTAIGANAMRVQHILNHLVRCCQLGCSACFAGRSFQIRVCSCARHRHTPKLLISISI